VTRCLIVEDDPALGPMFATVLERTGLNVTVAHSLAEARLMSGPWDVIVADVRLPNGDGRDLRSLHPSVPFVVISGFNVEDATAIEERYFLPKPFAPPKLQAIVRRALGER
jgi:DNA-binding response OmpR family regulator